MLTAWALGVEGVFENYKYSINLLIRFNKTCEKFSSVTRVLSILKSFKAF